MALVTVLILVAVPATIVPFEIDKDFLPFEIAPDQSGEEAVSRFGDLRGNWSLFASIIVLVWAQSMLEELLDRGFPITYSDLLFPAWSLARGDEAFAERIADPSARARVVAEMMEIYGQQTGPGPSSVQFRELDGRPDMTGRTLEDWLVDAGRPTTLDAIVEALIELQLQGGFIGIFHGMDESDIARIMRHPTAMFETDGDLVQPGVGFPHPRTYGSFPRILGRYVRELGVLTVEAAVHKMTGLPAAWWGQTDRGRLAEGLIADVTVFDAESITDLSTYTDPHHYSTGVEYVLVGGEVVLDAGSMTDALPGEFLSLADSESP